MKRSLIYPIVCYIIVALLLLTFNVSNLFWALFWAILFSDVILTFGILTPIKNFFVKLWK